MSLKINGVEPTRIQVDENGTITDLKKLYIIKNGEEKNCWIKPYKLTISKGSHSNVLVENKLTEYMKGTVLNNGEPIFHGSYLDITVTGHQGYSVSWKLNGVTQSTTNVTIQITGDIEIAVTETATVLSLTRPVISGSLSYDSYMGNYYLSCNITNNNPRAVKANIVVYSDGDRFDGNWTMNIPANSIETYHHGEMWSVGAKVQVTFSCSGYGDSTTTTIFGKYTGTGIDDETTSTTS